MQGILELVQSQELLIALATIDQWGNIKIMKMTKEKTKKKVDKFW